MHIPFDSDAAIRMSPAVKKSEYKKTKNSFLKLISLNKLVDVSSLLLKLGVCNSSVEKQAKEIFALCQRHETSDHPQYVAVNIFNSILPTHFKTFQSILSTGMSL